MKNRLICVLVLASQAFVLFASAASANVIAVTGSAIAHVEPQYVTISIAISSLSKKATEATQRTADLHNRVVEALSVMQELEIQTDKYRVAPRWERDDRGKVKKFLGYQANHDLVISMRDIKSVGEVVDAAIQAGAENVGSIKFHAEVTDSLQQAALKEAVAQARGRAEAIAEAAGGRLGELIELSTQDAAKAMRREIPSGVVYSRLMAGTKIMPSSTRVHVVVLGRWEFIEGADQ